MNNAHQLKIYKPSSGCPKCGSSMNRIHGSNGWFFSCSKYPSCMGSRNAIEISFTVFNIGNITISNNSIINCSIDGKQHTNLHILLKDGCFGVEIDDNFILLKNCTKIAI